MLKIYILSFIMMIVGTTQSWALEPQAGWGVAATNGEKTVKIGGRLQGIAEQDSKEQDQNLYLRRVRVNLEYCPREDHKLVFDVRNDNSNKRDKGDGEFQIGDAYWQISSSSPYINNLRLFRAKVDVSYSQTSSSKNLFSPDRAAPSEVSADFIVSGRRATNAQINGAVGNAYYQLAISEGLNSDDLEVLAGENTIDEIVSQSLVIGGKVRYYFFGSAEKNLTQDTFYGLYDSFSIGLGHFSLDNVRLKLHSDKELDISRKLTNLEISYSQDKFRFLSEAFFFEGLIGDLQDNVEAHGEGSYAQIEYVVSKFSPFIGHEVMDYWSGKDGYQNYGTYFGLNYYADREALRYGLRFKESELDKNLGNRSESKFQIYANLNF